MEKAMISYSLVLFIWILSYLCSVDSAVDLTVVEGTNGSTIVEASIAKISQSSVFTDNDQQMLRRIAYVETRDGANSDTYASNAGIWGVSETKYNATKNTGSNAQLQQKVTAILTSIGINWTATSWSDLRKPFYSALAARLYMLVITQSIPLASNINSQGTYWANYYTSSNGTQSDYVTAVNQLLALQNCSVNALDLFFVMDASGSVGYSNFQLMKNFVYNIADSFNIGSDSVRVGVMSYGSYNNYHFYLNTYSTKSSVLSAINNLPYSSGGTNTAGALDGMRTLGFSTSRGARPSSQGVPRVAIVITDGYSNSYSATVTAANNVHNAGIIVFAIGIAGANQNELNAIASQLSYVSFISSFSLSLLNSLQYTISQESCVASPDVSLGQTVTDNIGSGETKYLNYPLPNNNEGITVVLNVTNGSATLYASTVVSTPNEAFHDVAITTDRYEDVYIDPANLTNPGSADTVYVAIEGTGASNQIQVSATQGDSSTEPVSIDEFDNTIISKNYGATVTVECIGSGKPQPTLQWYKGGAIIASSNIAISNTTIDNTTVQSVITITGLIDNNEGVYLCVGTNLLPNGSVSHSQSFVLNVTGVFVVNLTGAPISSTSIYLSWALPFGYTAQYYLVDVTELETSRAWTFHAVQSHANIISLHPYYTYRCSVAVVTNITHPYSSSIYVITHQSAPTGVIQAPLLIPSSSSELNVTWLAPPRDQQNGVITYYIIVITEVMTNITIQYTSNVTWYLAYNLHPHYTYSINIAAVTISQGPSLTGINITMPEAAPATSPTNVQTSNVSSQSFRVSWLPPTLEDQNGIIRQYILLVHEIGTGVVYNMTTSNTYIIVSSIRPYTSYNVSVSAYTVTGGPYSEWITITTLQEAPGAPPNDFNATVTSPYSAFLAWNPPPQDQINGIIIGYIVRVTILETGQNLTLYSNTTSLYVDGLRPFRTFACVIAAFTNVGVGPYSAIFTVSTPQDAPSSSPVQVRSTSVTSRTFSLHWDPPPYDDQNGVINYYVIRIVEVETGIASQYTSYNTLLSVSSLHPAYTYYCSIAAYTIALGPFSIQFNITTNEDAPSEAPENFMGTVLSSSSVSLSWNPPPVDGQNGEIITYYLNITSINNGYSTFYTSNMTTIQVNGLTAYTRYTCIVAAETKIGRGPYTTTISFTTMEDAPNSSPSITTYFIIDTHSVAIQWNPPAVNDHNGIIRKYVVRIVTVSGNSNTITTYNTTGTTAIIGELIPSYTYEFSVAAYTVAAGPFTANINMTLPEDVPSGYPKELSVNSTTPYSVTLTWDPPSLDEQSGNIIGYVINVTHADTLETVQYHTVMTRVVIGDLDPYTTYVCVVAAETSVGVGPFSHLFFVQTDESSPDSPPQHPNAIALSPTSIHITWDPPLLQDHNGIIREYRVNVTEAATSTITEHVINQTQLVVTDLKPFHVYYCSIVAVTVDEGPYTVSVSVLTQEAAPSMPPQTLSVSVTSSRSLFLSWNAPPSESHNGIIRKYAVAIQSLLTGVEQTFTTLNRVFNVSSLNPYTSYSVRVAAITVETGPFTIPYNVTTFEDEPTSPPESFNATASDSSSLFLQWAPPIAEGINGIIQHYNISVTEIETGIVSYHITTSLAFVLTDLHPFYTYKCTVAAVTIGTGPITSLVVQMPEDVPSTSPSNVLNTVLTSQSLTLTWDSLPLENQNGLIRYYLINVTETDTGTHSQYTSTTTGISLTGLHPYYTYSISVAAFTISSGPFSNSLVITTAQNAPSSSPVNINAGSESSNGVILEWSPPPLTERNGIIIGYNITIEDTTSNIITILHSSALNVTVTSLDPYTMYQYSIAAYTVVGLGPYSALLFFQTQEAAPSEAPQSLALVAITSTTVTLTWDPPPISSHNGIIREYTVTITDSNNEQSLYNVSRNTLTISDLAPYTQYDIAVSAYTVTNGPFSSILSVTTNEAVPSIAPSITSLTALNPSTLSLSWNPLSPLYANGIVRQYIVNVTVQESSEQYQYSTVSTNLTIPELHPHYTYTVYIAAVTVGMGPFSSAHNIKMPQSAPTGAPHNLTGLVLNSTAIQVSWYPPHLNLHNGVISSYTVTLLELSTNTTQRLSQNSLTTTFIFTGLHPYYEYRISVAAYTVANGPASVIAVTTLEDVPSVPPQNVTVNVSSSTSAFLQWLSPETDSQNGIIRYYVINLYNSETGTAIINSSQGITNHLLTGLHPFYYYDCNVAAVTVGFGPFSSNISFQMLEDVPSSAPMNIRVTAVTSTNALLLWDPPLLQHRNGILTVYTVRISKRQSMESQIVTTSSNYLNVSSLEPHTEYRFAVSASTSKGGGPFSNYSSLITRQDAPIGAPFNVVVMENSISASSFRLQWQSPPDMQLNGILIGYLVMVVEVNTGTTYTNLTSTPSIVIDSLHPYYTYICSVAAVTVTAGPFSENITVQTAQAPPSGPPLSVGVNILNSRNASIVWNPPLMDEINGIIQYYAIKLYETETSLYYMYQTSNISLFVNALHPYYTYSVSVAAVTVGTGPYSNVVSFTTLQDSPTGMPQNVSLTAVNATSLQLKWSPILTNLTNGPIVSYSVNVTEIESGDTISIQNITNVIIVINDLHPYYNYIVLVAGVNVVGIGPYAQSIGRTHEAAPTAPPESLSANVLSSSVANIIWLPPHPSQQNGLISRFIVTLYSIQTGETVQYSTTNEFFHLSNLHPFYNYECRVAAVTVAPGPYELVNFQMQEDVPLGPPQNLTVTPLNQSTILIAWSPPVASLQNGIIRNYTINILNNKTGELKSYIVTNKTTLTVTNLKPFSVHSIGIAASTIGSGPFATFVTVTLPEGVPSLPPSQFVAEIISNGSNLYLSWAQPPVDEINGILLGYQLSCTGQNDHSISDVITGTTAFLNDLYLNNHYTCQICAYTSVGCGPIAVTYVSTFENSLIGPPHSFNAIATGTTINIHWEAPFDPYSVILSYVVSYYLMSTSFNIETPRPRVTIANIKNTSCLISSLLVSSTYHVEVFAVTEEESNGPISEPLLITTSSPEMMSPRNMTCAAVSTSNLHCTWLPPQVTDYDVQSYTIKYRLAEGFDYYPGYGTTLGVIPLQATMLEYSLNDLQPHGGYIIELEAYLLPTIGSGYSGSSESPLILDDNTFKGSTTIINVTHPEIPSATVEAVSITVMSPKSMRVTWKPPKRKDWKGRIESYKLTLTHHNGNSGINKRAEAVPRDIVVQPMSNHPDPSLAKEPLENETHVIEGLEENFEYTLSIVVTNAVGDSISSAAAVTRMPQAAPTGPPLNITLQNVSLSALNITWLPPDPLDANGVITGYKVIFNRTEINDVTEQFLPSSQNYFYKRGLQQYEFITIKVAAKTVVGFGPYSLPALFRTSEGIPSPPLSLEASLFNDTAVLLKWDTHYNEPVLEYQVFYSGYSSTSSDTDGPHQKLAKSSQLLIANLMPGYFYQFMVRARNNAGVSANSSVLFSVPATENIPDITSDTIVSNVVSYAVPVVSALFVALVCIIMTIIIVVSLKKNRKKRNHSFSDEPSMAINPLTNLPSIETGPGVPLKSLDFRQKPTVENEYEEVNLNNVNMEQSLDCHENGHNHTDEDSDYDENDEKKEIELTVM